MDMSFEDFSKVCSTCCVHLRIRVTDATVERCQAQEDVWGLTHHIASASKLPAIHTSFLPKTMLEASVGFAYFAIRCGINRASSRTQAFPKTKILKPPPISLYLVYVGPTAGPAVPPEELCCSQLPLAPPIPAPPRLPPPQVWQPADRAEASATPRSWNSERLLRCTYRHIPKMHIMYVCVHRHRGRER